MCMVFISVWDTSLYSRLFSRTVYFSLFIMLFWYLIPYRCPVCLMNPYDDLLEFGNEIPLNLPFTLSLTLLFSPCQVLWTRGASCWLWWDGGGKWDCRCWAQERSPCHHPAPASHQPGSHSQPQPKAQVQEEERRSLGLEEEKDIGDEWILIVFVILLRWKFFLCVCVCLYEW